MKILKTKKTRKTMERITKTKSTKTGKKISAKYSAQKLYEKGVLVEIDNVPPSSFRAVTIEFSTTDQVNYQ